MNAIQTKKGFTIIEVVLVLAIAGLIFLMVFIALPALQSGQRDSARKTDVSVVASAINDYTSGNRGTAPTTSTLQGYIDKVSDNTDKSTITVQSRGSTASTAVNVSIADGQIKAVSGAKCGTPAGKATNGTANQPTLPGTKRQYAVITLLEAGGGTSFCQDV